jgi:hypothetical protein
MGNKFRRVARFASLALFGLCALSWLWFYLDSIHERRRAERLITELKSFPFSTAGFPEVREFVIRHGGIPILQFPIPRFSPPGLPVTDDQGYVHLPQTETYPTCTEQDCRFEITLNPQISRIWSTLINDRTPICFRSALVYSGIRPWVAGASFEIKDGMLVEVRTSVGQIRLAKIGSYEGLIPLGYSVYSRTHSRSDEPNGGYLVFRPHITGGFSDALVAKIVPTSNASIQRGFDIDPHCFTAVFRACRGLEELAPSAWADYQTGKAKPMEDNK